MTGVALQRDPLTNTGNLDGCLAVGPVCGHNAADHHLLAVISLKPGSGNRAYKLGPESRPDPRKISALAAVSRANFFVC
jgi:hypothetical protein